MSAYRSEYQREYRAANRDKIREQAKAWRERHPDYNEYAYWKNVKHRYGITKREWNELLIKQEGRCAICRTDVPGGRGTRRGWHIDHNHETGQVRGLLCYGCNGGIGFFKEDPDVLSAAIEYIRAAS